MLELVFDINLIKEMPDLVSLKRLAHVLAGADWNRFQSYGKRVRFLKFDESLTYRKDPNTPDLDATVVAVLCLHHPFGGVFLPNLQELSWTIDREDSALSILPFLSGQLRKLSLQLPIPATHAANALFKAIMHRTPSLVNFRFETKVEGIMVHTSLARWLQTTENLESIALPPDYWTPALIQTLGSLPKLKRIQQSVRSTHASNSTTALHYLPASTFPNLVKLGFNATLSEARGFLLSSQEVVSRLTGIDLYACGRLDTESLLRFTRHVVQNCPRLTSITLRLFISPGSGEQSISPLNMTLLESLYPCTALEKLRIGYPLPFTFQQEDIERMARAWPQMVNFDVCSDPDFSLPLAGQLGNPLSILSVLAKVLPKLEVLSLYFNKQEAPPLTGNLQPQYQFQNLTHLGFGLSPIPISQSRQVAFYIASLCKARPDLVYGKASWHTGALPDDWTQTKAAWKEVNKVVGLAMDVKRAGLSGLRETAA